MINPNQPKPQPQRFDELKQSRLGEIKKLAWELSGKYNMSSEDTLALVSLIDAEQSKLSNIKYAMSEIMAKL